MAWTSLSDRIGTLPLILAGPVLRRVEKDSVSVWIALKESRMLALTVWDDNHNVVMTSTAQPTISLGVHLHVLVITAKLSPIQSPLLADKTYHYNVTGSGVDLTSSNAVVYTEHGFVYPTFSLPPTKIDDLRIVHASCRKMHAQGYDAFTAVDIMIEEEAKEIDHDTFAKKRPHQLFLTGDQIYADDVSGLQLFLITDICSALLGWNEEIIDSQSSAITSPNLTNSLPGARASLIIDQSGFEFPYDDAKVPANHLMFLGEYYCMYLLMWSPVLWPSIKEDYPTRSEVYNQFAEVIPKYVEIRKGNTTIVIDEFQENLESAVAFHAGLGKVQRSLANVPTYMICDDHEITDDWFITFDWTHDVLSSFLGKRIMQNGVLAYAIFQAWGNTPEQFEGQNAGKLLLDILPQWGNYDADDIITPVGSFPETTTYWESMYYLLGLPDLAQTSSVSPKRLIPANQALHLYLTYNYHIIWNNHEVFVLDTRNERSFPGPSGGDPPVLISSQGLTRQITDFSDDVKVTFLVIATPISSIPNIEDDLKFAMSITGVPGIYYTDGEVYVNQESGIESLYEAIGKKAAAQQQRKNSATPTRVVVLSGDVHYAFTNRVEYWADRTYNDTEQTPQLAKSAHFVLAQLCASALKNEKGAIKDDEKTFTGKRKGTNRAHIEGYNDDELTHPRVIVGWVPPSETFKRVGTIPFLSNPTLDIPMLINPIGRVVNIYELVKSYKLPLPSITLSTQPDWTYRIDYLTAIAGTPRPGSKPPEIATDPAYASPASALQCYLDSASNAQQYVKYDGIGREAVGKNNLGEIRFTWGTTEDTKIVKHQLWWRLDNSSNSMPEQEPFPLSAYEVLLGTDPVAYPKPRY